MHATFVTQCTISLIALQSQNSSHERFKHPATDIWKGMLMRQIQRRSLIWLVKAFLLINRSKSKKIFVSMDVIFLPDTERIGEEHGMPPHPIAAPIVVALVCWQE